MTDMRDNIARIVADEKNGGDPYDIADAVIAALPDMVAPLVWDYGPFRTTDDDNGPMEGQIRNLHSWRSGGYIIIRQARDGGLYLMRTPDGKDQLAHCVLSEVEAAAQAHHAAAVVAALTGSKQ